MMLKNEIVIEDFVDHRWSFSQVFAGVTNMMIGKSL